jgi:hypothetical protein
MHKLIILIYSVLFSIFQLQASEVCQIKRYLVYDSLVSLNCFGDKDKKYHAETKSHVQAQCFLYSNIRDKYYSHPELTTVYECLNARNFAGSDMDAFIKIHPKHL